MSPRQTVQSIGEEVNDLFRVRSPAPFPRLVPEPHGGAVQGRVRPIMFVGPAGPVLFPHVDPPARVVPSTRPMPRPARFRDSFLDIAACIFLFIIACIVVAWIISLYSDTLWRHKYIKACMRHGKRNASMVTDPSGSFNVSGAENTTYALYQPYHRRLLTCLRQFHTDGRSNITVS
jgi:hypothetical protein